MLRLYPILLALQVFCLYHAFKNKADQKWFYLIFFLPTVGALIYLYYHFYSKENISTITEGVKGVLNTNYETKKLENELDFSDTVHNKTKLADRYYDLGRFKEARLLYESCRESFNKNNPDLIQRLIRVYFAQKDFGTVIEYSENIRNRTEFIDSQEHIMLAWSLYNNQKIDEAKREFIEMDGLYCNYSNRLEFAKFLNLTNEKKEANKKIAQLIDEINQMNTHEKKGKREIFRAIKQFRTELASH